MEVVAHTDAGEFARLVRPLLEPDPVRHTHVLTVLHAVLHRAFAPVTMLTLHEDDGVVGALLRTDGRPALVSGVPLRGVPAVVDALQERDPEPVGAQGPVAEAEAVAGAWAARTGATVAVGMRMRLFALDTLRPPEGVPGAARAVGLDDEAGIDRLATWRAAFAAEHDGTGSPPRRPREDVVRALEGGAGELLWDVGGEPVAQAAARAVSAGMSRIGPVYTPPEHRRRGYAAAVTAAAARWAQDRGARHVLLYTDLANPTTNRLYPRLGFRPRYDAVELRFGPAADRR
jgi:GNAT superfamily N-acetyltransferase